MSSIDLPPLVRQRAASSTTGQRWLEGLPSVVEMLVELWGLEVGATYAGGTAGYVARARRADGQDVVLKVAMPLSYDEQRAFDHSATAHRIAAGCGSAMMFEHAPEHHALLLERLGPNVHQLDLPLDDVLDAIADTLATFWHRLDQPHGLPTGPEKAAWLANFITESWGQLGQPCSRRVIDRAVEYCEQRASAFNPSSAVLVHGDAHGWNTVQAADGFKFVDPEGIWSEPAHDLAIPMREYNEPLLAGDTQALVRQRAERLARRCDVDPDAVWQWGLIERVSTGLVNMADFGEEGAIFLEVAERCIDGDEPRS